MFPTKSIASVSKPNFSVPSCFVGFIYQKVAPFVFLPGSALKFATLSTDFTKYNRALWKNWGACWRALQGRLTWRARRSFVYLLQRYVLKKISEKIYENYSTTCNMSSNWLSTSDSSRPMSRLSNSKEYYRRRNTTRSAKTSSSPTPSTSFLTPLNCGFKNKKSSSQAEALSDLLTPPASAWGQKQDQQQCVVSVNCGKETSL